MILGGTINHQERMFPYDDKYEAYDSETAHDTILGESFGT